MRSSLLLLLCIAAAERLPEELQEAPNAANAGPELMK